MDNAQVTEADRKAAADLIKTFPLSLGWADRDDLPTQLVQAFARHRLERSEPVGCYRHKKRGTVYEVLGEAELQAASWNVHEGDNLVIYRGEDGKLWARHHDEFHDGRFERIATAPDTTPPEPVAEIERLREVGKTILKSHMFSGGRDSEGEYMKLHFRTAKERSAFIDAYIELTRAALGDAS